MAKIYKQSDRRTIKIQDITVSIAPMTLDQRQKYSTYMSEAAKTQNLSIATEAVYYSIRCGIKNIEGVEDSNGEAYRLEFDSQGLLTEACLQDLLTLEQADSLQKLCMTMIQDFAKETFDIEGVEVVAKK